MAAYTTGNWRAFPFTKDHAFDENEVRQKTFEAIEQKKSKVDPQKHHPKIDPQAFRTQSAFDFNESATQAARLAEAAGATDAAKKAAQPKKTVKTSCRSFDTVEKLDTKPFMTTDPLDENETLEKAYKLAEEAQRLAAAKKSHPTVDTHAFMTTNALDENETLEKAAKLAEKLASER